MGSYDNPLFDIALQSYAALVKPEPDLADRLFYLNGKPLGLSNLDQLECAKANMGAKDISAYTATIKFARNKWFDLGANVLTAAHGGTLAEQSVLDLYNISKFGPTFEFPSISNWLTPYGMGNFITKLGEGLAIRMNTPATSVDWSGKTYISIETPGRYGQG